MPIRSDPNVAARTRAVTHLRTQAHALHPEHLSRSLTLQTYGSAVTRTRLTWSMLSAMSLQPGASQTDLQTIAPVDLASQTTTVRSVLNRLVKCGMATVENPDYNSRYALTPAGEAMLTRLDRWAFLEQQAVLDELGLL